MKSYWALLGSFFPGLVFLAARISAGKTRCITILMPYGSYDNRQSSCSRQKLHNFKSHSWTCLPFHILGLMRFYINFLPLIYPTFLLFHKTTNTSHKLKSFDNGKPKLKFLILRGGSFILVTKVGVKEHGNKFFLGYPHFNIAVIGEPACLTHMFAVSV